MAAIAMASAYLVYQEQCLPIWCTGAQGKKKRSETCGYQITSIRWKMCRPWRRSQSYKQAHSGHCDKATIRWSHVPKEGFAPNLVALINAEASNFCSWGIVISACNSNFLKTSIKETPSSYLATPLEMWSCLSCIPAKKSFMLVPSWQKLRYPISRGRGHKQLQCHPSS